MVRLRTDSVKNVLITTKKTKTFSLYVNLVVINTNQGKFFLTLFFVEEILSNSFFFGLKRMRVCAGT